MLVYAAIALFTSGLVLLITGLYSRLIYWRGSYYVLENQCSEALDRALSAEGERAKIQSEMDFQKRTLTLIASRDSVAVLTDVQVQAVIQSIAQLVMSQQKTPEQMN